MPFRHRGLRRDSGVSWQALVEGHTMIAALVAGAVMLVLAVLGAVLAGESAALPFRMAASLLLHDAEYRHMPVWVALPLGSAIHFGVSLIYGFAFGLLMTGETRRQRFSRPVQALLGMAVALVAYGIDIQVIARFWYPWMLEPPQLGVALLHALGFGLPLGLLAPLAARRSAGRPIRSGRSQRSRKTRVTV
jgi:hypothetical protein